VLDLARMAYIILSSIHQTRLVHLYTHREITFFDLRLDLSHTN
jgi:hypothetical protein